MESNRMHGSQKGKKGLKVVLIIIAVIAGLLIFMSVGFVTISTGKIENYRDENGNIWRIIIPFVTGITEVCVWYMIWTWILRRLPRNKSLRMQKVSQII